ncbi:MAG: hypothetical protein RI959_1517 [Pseudomonadota bacterium]
MKTGHAPAWACALAVASLLLWVAGACVGSEGLENVFRNGLAALAVPETADLAVQVVWDIRMPRTLGAWLAGALLGLAGAIAQGLFRNPLADPYLLGSSSGASLGVALALAVVGGGTQAVSGGLTDWALRIGLTGAAFLGSVGAVFLTLGLARGVGHTLRLLLAGVVVGVVLGALTSLILLLSPDSLLPMQSFMLGSTTFVGWASCAVMAAVWSVCAVLAWAFARVLDGLGLGEATAISLGINLAFARTVLVGVLALATGAAVAQTGLIAFVGLAAPHLVRSAGALPHRYLIPLSSAMGAVLLCTADLLARGLLAPQELPVGLLTSLLGGVYLIWLMRAYGGTGGKN